MSIATVEQVMTRNPITVSSTDSIRIAIERMRDHACRRLPVVENNKLIGIVSDIDLQRATNSPYVLREKWYDEFVLAQIPVRACMSPNPITVTPQTLLVDAAKLMHDHKIGGLPVVDGDSLVGMVTETDLFNYLIRVLETKGDE